MAQVAYEDPEWITSNDVALMAGVAPATVRSWVHRGHGPIFYRIVRSVRYRRSDVIAWLEAMRQDPKRAS